MINIKENEELSKMNHSCAHLLAQAVKHLYPKALFWVGPVIEDGFYYDIDLGDEVITEVDLPKLEHEMKKISKDGKRIVRHEISKEEALEMFKNDPYKIDLINRMDENETVISCYTQGDFTDLCRGPHVDTVKELKYFKLLKVSGAYWKGDSKNKMLQRIYGVCFKTEEDLNKQLEELEDRKNRDHRKIGKELDIFMTDDLVGRGLPMFLPNGYIIWQELEEYIKGKERRLGYQHVLTPCVGNVELYKTSGHWDHYKENMFPKMEVDGEEFVLRPMNCPHHMMVYANKLHSYKDLPLRLGELGQVHRHEASGALNGLFRVRTFTQDDAHLFVTPDQLEEEVKKVLQLVDRIYSVFGLPYEIELSTRPESGYIGSEEIWDASEKALAQACVHAGKEYKVNPGDGAFYGPKLDIHIKDSLGRVWQCGTVQLDMNLPERFECKYVDADGTKKTPIMLHRVVYGSVERFIGILIEHFGGHFPLWLAPRQFVVIPVHHEKHVEYANKVCDALTALGMRATVDSRNEKLGYRVREAQLQKVTYQIVVGDGEQENNTVTIRQSGKKDSVTLSLDEALAKFKAEVDNKTLFGK